MSKLDEKLLASVKPSRSKPAAEPAPADKPKENRKSVQPQDAVPAGAGRSESVQALFPERIWPD